MVIGLALKGLELLQHRLVLLNLHCAILRLLQLPELAEVVDVVMADLVLGQEDLLQGRLREHKGEEV